MPTKDPEKLKAKKSRWYQKNKERILLSNSTDKADEIRSRHLKRKFGMSLEEWNEKFHLQGEKCACCGAKESGSVYGWHTDHDHVTGVFRAILCRSCNIALGLVDDSIGHLQMLVEYLRKHNASI